MGVNVGKWKKPASLMVLVDNGVQTLVPYRVPCGGDLYKTGSIQSSEVYCTNLHFRRNSDFILPGSA